ncbi:signal transduction histidine kinase [Scopulibacillus darangshiensis]|uniref:Heme sensor protein HssS n=1 Tax=Scopulibacillus darangshiensis TaxID=442528 RepID=A0A4R2NM19_9BACL|nr:HAMP domain-containing sensor histidine kinase [Scopulibacillus darangshiensis]TCP22328.1 signal transduction histidine kinase [Scopulibacillus darangshiensis]
MRTLYLRIVMTTILVMILSSLFAFIISNAYYQFALKPYNDKKITRMAKDVQTFYKSNPDVNLDAYLENIGRLGYQLYLADGNHQGSFFGGEFRKKDLDPKVIQKVIDGSTYHGIIQFPSKLFVTGFFDNALINTIGVPIKVDGKPSALFIRPNVEVQFGELRIFFAVILVLTIFLSIIFVAVSTRYIVKPITKLTDATKRIAKGKYNIQLNVKRRDEIGKLASNFSQMARSLEQLEEMRQEFVSNVSHEIQSPLASIQGFSQTLQSKQLPEDQRQHYLSIIEDESRRMSQLSKQLLTLASLDKEEGLLEKSTFDVAAQIKQVLFMTEWSWREKDLAIDMELPSTYLYGDKKLLHQVWTNLITNSIKFTEAGGTLLIRLGKKDNTCQIEIEDTGIGISDKDLPNVFHRFYKADKARERKEGSSGLGLAITKKIIDMHEGEIHVESKLGEGTIFRIELPRM